MSIFDFFRSKPVIEILSPGCSCCACSSATVQLLTDREGVRLIYSGPGGSNGSKGDRISPDRANAIRLAFSAPYSADGIGSAGFYDDAGFCRPCAKFYCENHWNVSGSGAGVCPEGHFKSLDPHWSPE
jgi:hypothetical protein